MNYSKLVWLMILGTMILSFKFGRDAKAVVQHSHEVRESQLQKAMMDLD